MITSAESDTEQVVENHFHENNSLANLSPKKERSGISKFIVLTASLRNFSAV